MMTVYSKIYNYRSKHYNEFVRLYSTEIELIFSAFSDVSVLFEKITQQEISNQQFGVGSLQAHIRLSLIDQRLDHSRAVSKDLNLLVLPIEDLTVRLLEKRYENLVGLKRAFKEAVEKVDLTITDRLRPINTELTNLALKNFQKLDELEYTRVSVPIRKRKCKDAELEYMNVLLKALKITTQETEIDQHASTYYCAEELSSRLLMLTYDILDKKLATLEELKTAFKSGYDESNTGKKQRLQELTYDMMMASFNRIQQEG
jgi:hypothetical protein